MKQIVQAPSKPPAGASADALLIDVAAVAKLLSVSTRHIHRMRDAGLIPAPVKVGRSTRWRRADLDAWIAGGCPAVRARRR